MSSPRTVASSDVTIHLQHQNIIREKYSSPSGSDLSDVNMGDTSHARVLSIDTGDGSCPEDLLDGPLSRQYDRERSHRSSSASRTRNKCDRNTRPYMYSTSASDSEDGGVPENNLSRAKSRSSQSIASQASTLTIRSTGSGATGFRRNRSRASIASTRSSASDRTLTCDSRNGSQETLVDGDNKVESATQSALFDKNVDNLSDSGIHSKHTDTATDNSAENDGHDSRSRSRTASRRRERSLPREEYRLSDDLLDVPVRASNKAKSKEVMSKQQNPLKDPTSVARKVLAETGHQMQALEAMQRWSVQSIKQKWEDKGESSPQAERPWEPIRLVPEQPEQPSPPVITSKPPLSPPKAVEAVKPIPCEPDRPAPTLAKPQLEPKPVVEPKLPLFPQAIPAKPKPILANSLMDGVNSYTCNPGERVSFLQGSLDFSFSQSELESENELSVIEEESEGVSDINNSYSHDELAARIRGLQFSKSPLTVQNVVSSDTSSVDLTWYEDGSPSVSKHNPAKLGSRSPSPSTPRSGKTVTFQEEVQMEILSQCDEILDDPDLQIHETDLDEGLYGVGLEGEEMSVDGDLTPTAEIHNNTVRVQPEQVEPDDYCATRSDSAKLKNGVASSESAICYKPPQIPPPPVGYKAPPPYPGPRRPGSKDSTTSGDLPGPIAYQPNNIAPVPPKATYNQHIEQKSNSVSPNEGLDLNTPQNLARMSKQLYQANSSAPVNGSFRVAQEQGQSSLQTFKPTSANTRSWNKERSYDGTGALRSVSFQSHKNDQQQSNYPNKGPGPGHQQYAREQYHPPAAQNYPDHRAPYPRHYTSQTQQCQVQGHPNTGQPNGYPVQVPRAGHNQRSYMQHGPHHGKEWSRTGTDNMANYQEIDPRLVNHNFSQKVESRPVNQNYPQGNDPRLVISNYPHRQHNAPNVSPSRQRNQSNGYSSPNSVSSHDSYAEMRSIFPGGRSPQDSFSSDTKEGGVRYGDTTLHASKC